MIQKLILAFFLLLFLQACDKISEPEPEPYDPLVLLICQNGHYCFQDAEGNFTVSYSGQTARLNQLSEMSEYLKSSYLEDATLEATVLIDMFSNADGNGSSYFTETAAVSGKQLKNKCFLANVDAYEALFHEVATASQSAVPGAPGISGEVFSINDPSKSYLLDENGRDLVQLIEKGLMGDVFYFQAMGTYLEGVENGDFNFDDPVSPEDGLLYTEAEHKFDEAFGYFGIPDDFLEDSSTGRFYGKYCNSRNSALGTNESIFNAFVNARIGISDKDSDVYISEILDIRLQWHKVIAGTAIHYLKSADENINDPALKCHAISEAHAFIGNMLHNEPFSLSPSEVNEALAIIGEDFYSTTSEDLSDCILYLIDHTEIELTDLPNL